MKWGVGEPILKRARRTYCHEWKHTASWLMVLKVHSHKRINNLGHIIREIKEEGVVGKAVKRSTVH